MSGSKKLKSLFLTKNAQADLLWYQKSDPKKLVKIMALIQSALIDPERGIGKPERLKYQKQIIYSRRIDLQNRMVYTYSDQTLKIIQLRHHYQEN
jgi:toxin YoeB